MNFDGKQIDKTALNPNKGQNHVFYHCSLKWFKLVNLIYRHIKRKRPSPVVNQERSLRENRGTANRGRKQGMLAELPSKSQKPPRLTEVSLGGVPE